MVDVDWGDDGEFEDNSFLEELNRIEQGAARVAASPQQDLSKESQAAAAWPRGNGLQQAAPMPAAQLSPLPPSAPALSLSAGPVHTEPVNRDPIHSTSFRAPGQQQQPPLPWQASESSGDVDHTRLRQPTPHGTASRNYGSGRAPVRPGTAASPTGGCNISPYDPPGGFSAGGASGSVSSHIPPGGVSAFGAPGGVSAFVAPGGASSGGIPGAAAGSGRPPGGVSLGGTSGNGVSGATPGGVSASGAPGGVSSAFVAPGGVGLGGAPGGVSSGGVPGTAAHSGPGGPPGGVSALGVPGNSSDAIPGTAAGSGGPQGGVSVFVAPGNGSSGGTPGTAAHGGPGGPAGGVSTLGAPCNRTSNGIPGTVACSGPGRALGGVSAFGAPGGVGSGGAPGGVGSGSTPGMAAFSGLGGPPGGGPPVSSAFIRSLFTHRRPPPPGGATGGTPGSASLGGAPGGVRPWGGAQQQQKQQGSGVSSRHDHSGTPAVVPGTNGGYRPPGGSCAGFYGAGRGGQQQGQGQQQGRGHGQQGPNQQQVQQHQQQAAALGGHANGCGGGWQGQGGNGGAGNSGPSHLGGGLASSGGSAYGLQQQQQQQQWPPGRGGSGGSATPPGGVGGSGGFIGRCQQGQQQGHGHGHLGPGQQQGHGHGQQGPGQQGQGQGGVQQQQQGGGVLQTVRARLGPSRTVELEVPYHEGLSAALKRLPGSSYHHTARAWRLPVEGFEAAIEALERVPGVRLHLEGLHELPQRVMKAAFSMPDDSARYEQQLPPRLREQLMEFQREGVRFALRRGGRLLFGDEMGLGKTVQAIAVVAAYRDEWPVLIITPASLKEGWVDALHHWLGITDDQVAVVHSNKDLDRCLQLPDPPSSSTATAAATASSSAKSSGPRRPPFKPSTSSSSSATAAASSSSSAWASDPKLPSKPPSSAGGASGGPRRLPFKFLIMSYNFCKDGVRDRLAALRFQVVVCDESHAIKDPKSQRTKVIVPLLKQAKRVVLLSGTPALSRPKELACQLQALVPGAKLTMQMFGDRYCSGGASSSSRFARYNGASNHQELYSLLTATVMVRRLKRDVLEQLPAKRRQQVWLTLDAPKAKQLADLHETCKAMRAAADNASTRASMAGGSGGGGALESVADALTVEQRALLMQLYQKTAEVKGKVVQTYVEELLDQGAKFLIFAHHKCLMDDIEFTLNRTSTPFIRIDGGTKPNERQGLVDSFQNSDKIRAAILSIKAAGVGLTLTSASNVVFAELSWTPGEIVQAEDRAHRIGQSCSVNVYFLMVKNSIDDIIWNSVQNKLDNMGQVLDGGKDSLDVSAPSRELLPQNQATLLKFQHPPRRAGASGSASSSGGGGGGGGGGGDLQVAGGGNKQATLDGFFSTQGRQQQQQQRPAAGSGSAGQRQMQPTASGSAGQQQQLAAAGSGGSAGQRQQQMQPSAASGSAAPTCEQQQQGGGRQPLQPRRESNPAGGVVGGTLCGQQQQQQCGEQQQQQQQLERCKRLPETPEQQEQQQQPGSAKRPCF